MFDKKDNLFLEILMKHKKPFNDVMNKSLKYEMQLTPDIVRLKTMDIKVKKGKKNY